MLNNETTLNNEQETISFAHKLASILHQGNIVTLTGTLGCGKTFICREIIRYFCGADTNVISPTFNLLQTYKAKNFIIYHFDLYRLRYQEEIYELGMEDAFHDNLCLIEWPELILPLLPKPLIHVNLQIITDNKRVCKVVYC